MSHADQRSVNDNAPYGIDQIQIRPLDNIIERDGETFKVSPRAIQALAYLIENAGRPVTYSEINSAIWKDGCSENSFYQQIATLRKALGEDSTQPRYIKTIAKQGYMFIGADSLVLADPKPAEVIAHSILPRLIFPAVLALVFVVLLLALLPAWLNLSQPASVAVKAKDPREAMHALTNLLQAPKTTIVIERPDPAVGSDLQRALSNAQVLLLQFQLQAVDDRHVAIIPRFANTAIPTAAAFYKKLASHYHSVGGISVILKPVLTVHDGEIHYALELIDPKTQTIQTLFSGQQPRGDSGLLLQQFEQQMLSNLASRKLLDASAPPLLSDDTDANSWFIAAATNFYKVAKTRKDLEDSIRLSQKAIDTNPKNLLAYSILWAETVKLLSVYSEYDMDSILQRVDRSKSQALQIKPDYYRALLVDADSHCWLADYDTCAAGMHNAILARPFDAYSLDSLYWNLLARPDLQLQVAKQNYNLNPFYYDAFAAYRDALLALGNFHELSNLISYHSKWSDSSDWFIQAQSQTDLTQIKMQAQYYRDRFGALTPDLYSADILPSRYIGYSLLNANQPELALFWARNGMERDLPYFDLRVIELLASLWQGDWQPLNWQVERAYVMERHSDQNSLDKLSIAYFDFQTGWLPKAAAVLEELAPELAAEDMLIDSGNLRLFVYYSEIKKRQGDWKYTRRASAAIKEFLQTRDSNAERGIDFGLADVEFYALNNDREQALAQLEQAVYQQGWLPNSLWLWPPIEHNPFLKSLRSEPRFEAMVRHIREQLAPVCFKASCG